jgi:hypothetical protein
MCCLFPSRCLWFVTAAMITRSRAGLIAELQGDAYTWVSAAKAAKHQEACEVLLLPDTDTDAAAGAACSREANTWLTGPLKRYSIALYFSVQTITSIGSVARARPRAARSSYPCVTCTPRVT